VNAVHRYGYPLWSLVQRDLRARYAQTVLGWAWAFAYPLAHLLLYVFVFGLILAIRLPGRAGTLDFALYLMCGYLPLMALMEGVTRASVSLGSNKDLLSTVRFPAEVLPAIGVLTASVGEVVGLGLVIGLAAFTGTVPGWGILLLPFLVALRIAITLGLSWMVSVLNVFLGDLGESLTLLLTTLMFLTPIFYPADMIPLGLRWLLAVNPLYFLVSLYRWAILGLPAEAVMAPLLLLSAAAVVAIGLWGFRQTIERAKDVL
jgi:ABC-type polysaccharide/polyol phosphate export permease